MLWSKLKARQLYGLKFRRQQPIGNFIVDFACFEKRIVIELDGGQHAITKCKDIVRNKWLADEGFTVLRFWNNDVFENLDGITISDKTKMFSGRFFLPISLP